MKIFAAIVEKLYITLLAAVCTAAIVMAIRPGFFGVLLAYLTGSG